MSVKRGVVAVASLVALAGCSATKVETVVQVPPSEIASAKRYMLRVNTGDAQMDRFVYEFTYREVSKYLDLTEVEADAQGTVDVLFTTYGQAKTTGGGFGANTGWFTGGGTTATSSGIGASYFSSETKVKQLGTMVATVKLKDGRRLWWADVDLTGKGSVQTPSESARYMAKRLGKAMGSDGFTSRR